MIVTAIATPSFYYWLPKYRLSAGARQIAADLHLARMKAISQNTSYRLLFTAEDTYEMQKLDGVWDVAPGHGPVKLPEGITVIDPNVFSFSTSVFQSRGTADTGVGTSAITVTNGDLNNLVCIKLVGRVFIDDSSCN